MEKIRVYLDSGASLPKDLLQFCECYQFPYDSSHRPKRNVPKIAAPCELTWKEAHPTWSEMTQPWEKLGDPVPERVKVLIGKNNLRDCKHIGSALKMNCKLFLTSDKRDVWSKRAEIEAEFGLKIFHFPSEITEFRSFLKIN